MGLMLMKFERLRKLFIRSLAVGGILSAMSVAARARIPSELRDIVRIRAAVFDGIAKSHFAVVPRGPRNVQRAS